MWRYRVSAAARIVSKVRVSASSRPVFSNRSTDPRIEYRGVRISWEILARNRLFARLARSAARDWTRRASSARWYSARTRAISPSRRALPRSMASASKFTPSWSVPSSLRSVWRTRAPRSPFLMRWTAAAIRRMAPDSRRPVQWARLAATAKAKRTPLKSPTSRRRHRAWAASKDSSTATSPSGRAAAGVAADNASGRSSTGATNRAPLSSGATTTGSAKTDDGGFGSATGHR